MMGVTSNQDTKQIKKSAYREQQQHEGALLAQDNYSWV
jgi:hypothetical protein